MIKSNNKIQINIILRNNLKILEKIKKFNYYKHKYLDI